MDRKQKIMRLIIDMLAESQNIRYGYIGAITVMDPQVISLDFIAEKGDVLGNFNIHGIIGVPFAVKAQFDNTSLLNNYPEIQREIEQDIFDVSARINRLL